MSNSEESIFNAAVELEPDRRDSFLESACGGNLDLRRAVESLLHAYEAGQFLEAAPRRLLAARFEATQPEHREPLGTTIGPYKLREVLGEGGMGIVYAAEQEHPIRRKVALKVIKPGMDSKEVIARFQAEQQALALMDHPNIAKVHDAGCVGVPALAGPSFPQTEDRLKPGLQRPELQPIGRPYFVMELVRGMPITEYCDQRRLSPRDRLKLFITVCHAIQHAHQKGIVHRDLKPSNVMITLHDGVPVPKIIDFGVAKALNQKLTDHTLYTRVAQLLGTPMYMSPEQAELSGLEIDTRSDVYSLGVLLYELLTGQTPFDKETFSKLGYDELRRMIREDEPPRPSQRISTLSAEDRTTSAQRRGSDDRQLARTLRGELDWIVMKALEKDRTRRYGSADGLAADLQAHLDDKPVQACPPSWDYRLRKFMRRKRSVLIPMVILAVCLPLAAMGVYSLINTPEPTTIVREVPVPDGPSDTSTAPKALPQARVPRGFLPGLVPEPEIIPEVGRWQLITKKPRGVMRSGVWSPDEQRLAVAEANHVRIYDLTNLQLLHVLVAHSQPVTSVAWHPDGQRLASASEDGTVRLWTNDGAPTHEMTGHSGTVFQVAWRPDGELLASSGADGTVRLWNADGSQVRMLDEGDRHVFGIDWSPDGKLLASVGGDIAAPGTAGNPGDNALRLWVIEAGELLQKIASPVKHSALCVDWRPDGKQLAVGYGDVYRSTHWVARPLPDAGVRIWNLDGTPGPEVGKEFGSVSAVAWRPDGMRLAFGGRSGFVRMWNADNQSAIDTQIGHSIDLFHITWSRDGSRLLTTCRESVREWDGDKQAISLVGGLGRSLGFSVATWSPDGETVGGNSSLFWTVNGKPLATPPRPADNTPPWWDRDGRTRRPNGTAGPALDGSPPLPPAIPDWGWKWCWSTQGWLAGATWYDATAWIWDHQGKLVATLKGHGAGVEGVSWSPDGEYLVSSGGDSVRIWNKDGTPGPIMTGHTDEVYPVAWSPDGQWIASAGTDSTIRLWKPDGSAGPVFRGHQGLIMHLAWSPDSRKLASAGWLDSTFRVWDVATGKTLWQAVRLAPNQTVTLSPTGLPLHGDREAMEAGLLYLVETRDGMMDILSFDKFNERYGTLIADSLKSKVLTLVRAEELDEAVVLFDRLTANAEKGELTWDSAIGDSFLQHKMYSRAVTVFSSIIDQGNASWHIIKRRGAAYMGLKEYDKALADIATAVEMNPGDSSNFLWFPQSQLWESPPEVQEKFFDLATKAIALSPANYRIRANYHLHREDPESALADLNQAVASSGTLPVTDVNNLAWFLATTQHSALRDSKRAVELAELALANASEKDLLFLWNTVAVARYRNGDWTGTQDALQKSMELRSGGDSFDWFFLAMTHWQKGDKPEAVQWYEKSVAWMEKNKPRDEELLRFRAEAAELLGSSSRDEEPVDATKPTGK